MTAIHNDESRYPASKNGSGTMIGPTPSSKLIAVKAALFIGFLSASLAFFIRII